MGTPVVEEGNLEHSEYDPVKAREYYLRTRELKGRKSRSTKNLTKDQRSALSESNRHMSVSKRAEQTAVQKAQQVRMAALQAKATESSKRIREKLTAALEQLQATSTPDLNKIPENASPKLKAFLTKQNAKLQRSAQQSKEQQRAVLMKGAQEEMARVGGEIKGAIAKVRDDYAASRKALDAKYTRAADSEFDRISKQPTSKKEGEPSK